jgi:hypothetical protein
MGDGELTALEIYGLKLYSYEKLDADGTVYHGYKSRGLSSRWSFAKREVKWEQDTDGFWIQVMHFYDNHSEEYHKMLKLQDPSRPDPVKVTRDDLRMLDSQEIDKIVVHIYATRTGMAALTKADAPMSRLYTTRTVQILKEGKGIISAVEDDLAGGWSRKVIPFVI